jgi:hypothetical protein
MEQHEERDVDFEVVKLQPGIGFNVEAANFGGQLMPTRLWVLPHGDIKNKPSFIFEMKCPITGLVFVAQISEKMLADGLISADAMKILSEQ